MPVPRVNIATNAAMQLPVGQPLAFDRAGGKTGDKIFLQE